MCGICGVIGAPDREAVASMTAAMVHRGPDDDGFYADERAALGFRRLAIIDVAGGRQPLVNEDGAVHVVFNGEIYNHQELRRELGARGHRLRTESDGEVLAHLYEEHGADLVTRLNGIFAFAIWDARERRLLLARDHHGVKPLYYTERNGRVLFASELTALLASGVVPREIDGEAVGQYLVYQTPPPPLTMIRGVFMLPPGSYLVHENGRTAVRCYWRPPRQSRELVGSVEEAEEIVRTGLDAAVERQLMSERSLGLFLSGGIDSSALVALAAKRTGKRLKTFSVGFIGTDEELFSEWPWARLVAERYDVDHHEFVLTEAEFCDRLPRVIASMDQPTADGMNSYYVSLAAAQHVVVSLSGTGGDELFLGYPRDAALVARYGEAQRFEPLPAAYVEWVERLTAAPDGAVWRSVQRLSEALRTYARLDGELITPRGIAIFDETERSRVLHAEFLARCGGFQPALAYVRGDAPPDSTAPGDWLSRIEQRAYMSFVLLRDIDAMSMAHSLEVRVPFLDPEYGEALSHIPWEWKLRDGVGKWILKRAMRHLLPEKVISRPKMGFGLPYNIWMRRSLEQVVRDVLAPDRIRRRGVLDPIETDALVRRFYAGDDGVWRRVWTLFVLEAWFAHTLDQVHQRRAA